jgi:UDP-N-acetyl-D-mannosaminuronate dehydrogenase
MTAHSSVLEQKILDRSARIGIIGLGYVGLPEAVMFAQAGFPVTGFDLDPVRVDKVNAGDSYIPDVPSAVLGPLVSAGRLRAVLMPSPGSQPPKAMSNVECRMSNVEVEPPNPPKAETAALSSSEHPNSRTVEPPNDLDQRTQQLNELPVPSSGIRNSEFGIRNSKLDSPPAAPCPLPVASFRSQDCLCICVPTPLRKTRDPDVSYIELAGQVNGYMPHHVVSRVTDALNRHRKSVNGARILVLGMAYKPDVADTRESPALEILHLLRERGAELTYHDPHVLELTVGDLWLKSSDLRAETVSAQDCVVILTHHSAIDYKFVVEHAPLIVDTRNATRDVPFGREKIVRL